jgi:hypothetical protein
MNRRLAVSFSTLMVGFAWLNPAAIGFTAAAEIRCMCSVALKPGFAALVPDFERSSGHKVTFVYDTVGALTVEPQDVVLMPTQPGERLQEFAPPHGGTPPARPQRTISANRGCVVRHSKIGPPVTAQERRRSSD